MEFNISWFKEHPYLTGAIVIVGGTIAYMIVRKSGASSTTNDGSGYGYDMNTALEFANINAAQSAQEAQIQGQIQVANLQAGVANNQINSQLEAYKLSSDTQVKLATIDADTTKEKFSSNVEVLKSMFETARDEQLSNNELYKMQIQTKGQLANSAINMLRLDDRGQDATNMLALIMNQGDIASYNQGVAASNIAGSMSTASIINGLTGLGGSLLGGLF